MTAPVAAINHVAAADPAAAAAMSSFYGVSIPNPIGAAVDAGAEVARIASSVTRAGVWFSRPRNWVRIAYVAGGALLIVTGVVMIAQEGKAYALRASGVSNIIGVAGKVITRGKGAARVAA